LRPLADGGRDGGRAVAARERLLADHSGTVAEVIDAADGVADGRGSPAGADALTGSLRAELDRRDATSRLLGALADAVDAVGGDLPHDPVPEPPYLAVTSRGPVLRATLEAGRLVVVVRVFRVARDPVRYVRTGGRPDEVVRVEFHADGDRVVAEPESTDERTDETGAGVNRRRNDEGAR